MPDDTTQATFEDALRDLADVSPRRVKIIRAKIEEQTQEIYDLECALRVDIIEGQPEPERVMVDRLAYEKQQREIERLRKYLHTLMPCERGDGTTHDYRCPFSPHYTGGSI